MKKLLALLIVVLCIYFDSSAQQKPAEYMQITTIESVVGGGVGRSKIVITNSDGTQEERDLENLFSIAGINFKNIRSNENVILNVLKSFAGKGWKILSNTPLTVSPNQNAIGIFMTRYLLIREELQ